MDYLELISAQQAKAAHANRILLYIYVHLLVLLPYLIKLYGALSFPVVGDYSFDQTVLSTCGIGLYL
jgi:hypothetical protein